MNMPECNCRGHVILNHALGQQFFVCTDCKKEVTPSSPANPVSVEEVKPEKWEQLELFDKPWYEIDYE